MVGKKYTGEVKNSIGNGEAKEFICMTRGHELRVGGMLMGEGVGWTGIKGEKNGTTVIAYSIKCT